MDFCEILIELDGLFYMFPSDWWLFASLAVIWHLKDLQSKAMGPSLVIRDAVDSYWKFHPLADRHHPYLPSPFWWK